jgi:hypothetical protein
MDTDERRKIEAAIAKVAWDKKAAEANPGGAMQESIDAAMAQAKWKLLRIMLGIALLAAVASAIAIYFLRRR